MTEFLKLSEAARELNISEPTARRYVKSGKIPSAYLGGRYMIRREDIDEFLRRAEVRPGENLPLGGAPSSTGTDGAPVEQMPPDLGGEDLRRAEELIDLDANEASARLRSLSTDALVDLQRELLMLLRYRYGPRVFETREQILAFMESAEKARGDRCGERLRKVTELIGERVAELAKTRERTLARA